MRYHVSFCCNSPFSGQFNGKQMCFSTKQHKSLRKGYEMGFWPTQYYLLNKWWYGLNKETSNCHPVLFNLTYNGILVPVLSPLISTYPVPSSLVVCTYLFYSRTSSFPLLKDSNLMFRLVISSSLSHANNQGGEGGVRKLLPWKVSSM